MLQSLFCCVFDEEVLAFVIMRWHNWSWPKLKGEIETAFCVCMKSFCCYLYSFLQSVGLFECELWNKKSSVSPSRGFHTRLLVYVWVHFLSQKLHIVTWRWHIAGISDQMPFLIRQKKTDHTLHWHLQAHVSQFGNRLSLAIWFWLNRGLRLWFV